MTGDRPTRGPAAGKGLTADDLRAGFTEFFTSRGHAARPSIGLIPHHPSAPLFANAGMNQFLPVILGEESIPDPPRATSVQKCVRVKGRHDDIANIGRTWGHLTFFEMLGNFSFGDYFKSGAITFAWELLTEVWGIDPGVLWVTVHESDDEAAAIWAGDIGVPAERIQRMGPDNFWEMGETGPCGPSSEIYVDAGEELGPPGGPAHGGDQRFREVWNLVFMQYNRRVDGELEELPNKIIDTGAGLERLLSVLQDVPTVFDTDGLRRLVAAAEKATGRRYGDDAAADVSLRILADHGRSSTFLVGDGVFPSNEDRGYVLRRIIRRAVRQAFSMGIETPVMAAMVEAAIDVMGGAYPDLVTGGDLIVDVVGREEQRFRQTLRSGSALLDSEIDATRSRAAGHAGSPAGSLTLSGAATFKLHDTYGFPLELTLEIAEERGLAVDLAAFEAEMEAQRARARQAADRQTADPHRASAYREILDEFGPTDFTGYAETESRGRVLAVLGDELFLELFLERTPFYAEAGGQVGDTGRIVTDSGVAEVLDTVVGLTGLTVHRVKMVEGRIVAGQEAQAGVDRDRRDAIRRHHSGTHLLHWALRSVLGSHVQQHGSHVSPERLRFDFTHFSGVGADELAEVERMANAEVLANEAVTVYETTMEEARRRGALAFFGDRYGDVVRVVEAGHHSVELCGGTHVGALGTIGPIKVVSESSIGSNIRRVEALSGTASLERIVAQEGVLDRAAALLRVPPAELVEAVERMRADYKALGDELAVLRRKAAAGQAGELAARAEGGVVVADMGALERGDLQDLAVAVRDRPGVILVVLGSRPPAGGVALVAAARADAGIEAGALLAAPARIVGGGAGRGRDLSVAGGRDPSRLEEALAEARRMAAAPAGAAAGSGTAGVPAGA